MLPARFFFFSPLQFIHARHLPYTLRYAPRVTRCFAEDAALQHARVYDAEPSARRVPRFPLRGAIVERLCSAGNSVCVPGAICLLSRVFYARAEWCGDERRFKRVFTLPTTLQCQRTKQFTLYARARMKRLIPSRCPLPAREYASLLDAERAHRPVPGASALFMRRRACRAARFAVRYYLCQSGAPSVHTRERSNQHMLPADDPTFRHKIFREAHVRYATPTFFTHVTAKDVARASYAAQEMRYKAGQLYY